ncbi:MAG: hypothetical protein QXR73_01535 [Candidatus Micrarchaeaceae archaeon]
MGKAMTDKHEVPAWLYCQDILLSIKEELIAEALDTLDQEIKEKRIDIKGSMVTAQEGSEDIEKKMFVIDNLRHRADEIRDRYKSYMSISESDKAKLEPDFVERLESMRKFLLAVTQVSMLMDYSDIFNEWANDMDHSPKMQSPVDMLASTIGEDGRYDALEFASKRQKLMEYLGEQDAEIVRQALIKQKAGEHSSAPL